MIDKIKLCPALVRIADEALRKDFRSNPPGMITRSVKSAATTETATFTFDVDKYPVARLTALKAIDDSWWARSLEANLPAAQRGHNGCALRTSDDLFLALTRIRHFLKDVVMPNTLANLTPLGDRCSPGFIKTVEVFHQFHDPGRKILKASHVARQPNQQKPTGVFHSQSSAWFKAGLKTQMYSKADQMRGGTRHPRTSDPVRFEVGFRDPERLAQDTAATGLYTGKPGPRVACLAPSTVQALVQQGLDSLTGFGRRPDQSSLVSLSKVSRLLILAAGKFLFEPHRIEEVLNAYEETERPGDKTMRKVSLEVRTWLHDQILGPGSPPVIDLHSLPVADVRWPRREDEFQKILAACGAPDRPDPDIAEAWSETRFLTTVPQDVEMVGSIMPSRPAFPTGTI